MVTSFNYHVDAKRKQRSVLCDKSINTEHVSICDSVRGDRAEVAEGPGTFRRDRLFRRLRRRRRRRRRCRRDNRGRSQADVGDAVDGRAAFAEL